MPATATSLQSVAKKAGVSTMTVSRVLRGAPRVAAATRRRVLAAARALHYRPDPHVARLMQVIRGRKSIRLRAVLAVVREASPENELPAGSYQFVSLRDIRLRAEKHGFRAEEFWLGRDGVGPERLSDILVARGIEGLIVSPQSPHSLCAQLDYSHFAAATFGYGLSEPSLHRAGGNMTLGIQMAVAQLTARGYQRIGLAITEWIDGRSQHVYTGAMLRVQQGMPRSQRVPILLFPRNDFGQCGSAFRTWIKAHRPDALISFDSYVPEWLHQLGLRIPDDIGLVVHDWTQAMTGLAGIHQRRDHVAAAAVDLVATQLLHHERGVPEVPRQILIPPAWVDGPSVRPLPSVVLERFSPAKSVSKAR